MIVVLNPLVKIFCIGGLLGPVLFGFVIDRACLLWERNCDGSTGACLYYDNSEMAWLMFIVFVVWTAPCSAFGLLSWRIYIYKQHKENKQGHNTYIEAMTLNVGM